MLWEVKLFPELGPWIAIKDGDARAYSLFSRHYSFHHYQDNRRQLDRRIVGPSKARLVLLLHNCQALFVWKDFNNPAGEQGLYCSVFRNESQYKASWLILEAEKLAIDYWPSITRFYTYIDSSQVRPVICRGKEIWGYSFLKAGWRQCDYKTKVHGKLVFEKII